MLIFRGVCCRIFISIMNELPYDFCCFSVIFTLPQVFQIPAEKAFLAGFPGPITSSQGVWKPRDCSSLLNLFVFPKNPDPSLE